MQTPTGYAINADGQFVPRRAGCAIIFNPSFPVSAGAHRIAAYLTTALAVGAVGAWHLLRDSTQRARAQDVLHGDVDGGAGRAGADLRRRPAWAEHARASAGEGHGDGGHYQSHADGAPLILFGIPDDEAQRMDTRSRSRGLVS